MGFGHFAGDREAQPGPAGVAVPRFFKPHEGLENPLAKRLVDAATADRRW